MPTTSAMRLVRGFAPAAAILCLDLAGCRGRAPAGDTGALRAELLVLPGATSVQRKAEVRHTPEEISVTAMPEAELSRLELSKP